VFFHGSSSNFCATRVAHAPKRLHPPEIQNAIQEDRHPASSPTVTQNSLVDAHEAASSGDFTAQDFAASARNRRCCDIIRVQNDVQCGKIGVVVTHKESVVVALV
jgi:hypothetical protein